MFDLSAHPGRLFLFATLMPLVPAIVLAVGGLVRHLTRGCGGWQGTLHNLLGGDRSLPLAGYFTVLFMMAAAGLTIWGAVRFFSDDGTHPERWAEQVGWIDIGNVRLGSEPAGPSSALYLGYRIDRLTVLMTCMVTGIGSMIFLFALGYMKDETGIVHGRRGRFGRFYLYLSLFAFSMLNLLIADNLFQVFVSWELVGVCSFFLIGFYTEKKSAGVAANKAFIVNRVGDAGFLVGLAVAFTTFGTLNIAELNEQFAHGVPHGISHGLWVLLGLGLFCGAAGKSAQVPLQTWLPDAMEGPTPVSALIHAATMVAAGVYLVGRCFPMFAPEVLLAIAYVGLITLFLSATVALVATDIKRVLAFSTCSQLGYMMLAIGVGGWSAGLFHLLTHAFFKALLFLGAGSVIHGLHHEQDLRRMGGLRKVMPVTAYSMLIGVLAISGAPLLSGWYSKDAILADALGFSLANPGHFLLFFGPLLTAGLTAFYMFRLWLLAFGGTSREPDAHPHESPAVMTLPLVVLAACSVAVAWGWPVWDAESSALGQSLAAVAPHGHVTNGELAHKLAHSNHLAAGLLALLAAVAGGGYAWVRYGQRPPTSDQLREPTGVFANRWYFDALYDSLFVRRTVQLAEFTATTDRTSPEQPTKRSVTLDGLLTGVAKLVAAGGAELRKLQSGRVRGYVLAMGLTVLILLGMLFAVLR
ncbi:MAG: NADH-quinone oxidoreductase subunit L [Fimbriiglobus sp.]|nr:NADH-quinone oxidoreductase subunit L [Fimbriiglobus sp.]